MSSRDESRSDDDPDGGEESSPDVVESTVDDVASSAAADEESSDRSPNRLSPDLAFDVVKNRRRRYALGYLGAADGVVQLSDLAEYVAARENDTTVEALSEDDRKGVYTALYQSHLPKLADAGIVEYDRSKGLVEVVPERLAQIESYTSRSLPTPDEGSSTGLRDSLSAVLSSSETEAALDEPLSPDQVYDLLKNRRRRAALERLHERGEWTPLSDLAVEVAAAETDATPESVSAADRKRAYTALHQTHLPTLDAAGLVEFDVDDVSESDRGPPRARIVPGAMSRLEPFVDLDAVFDSSGTSDLLPDAVADRDLAGPATTLLTGLVGVDLLVVVLGPGATAVTVGVVAMPLLIAGLFVAHVAARATGGGSRGE